MMELLSRTSLNEMLKSSQDIITETIAKVFNLLFDSQLYPSLWSKNMLLPLHKGGNLNDLDNYWGISTSISSCFVRLYNLVLTERLIDAIDNFDLMNQNQLKGSSGRKK